MKKWLLPLFALLVLLIPVGFASANSDYPDSFNNATGYKVHVRATDGTQYLFVSSEPFAFDYVFLKTNERIQKHVKYSGQSNWVNPQFSEPKYESVRIEKSENVFYSSHNILHSGSDDVFFSVIHPAEKLLPMMTEVLVDGGIISTALILLGIILGVSLVPRLVRSFLH